MAFSIFLSVLIADLDSIKIGYVFSKYLSKEVQEDEPKEIIEASNKTENTQLDITLNEFKALYNQLLEFKSHPNFIEYGFKY